MRKSLESVPLRSAIHYKSESMKKPAEQFSLEKWWENILGRIPVYLISLLLVGGGAYLLWRFPEGYLRHALGEATIIAALLLFLVDPFLKARLLRDASKGLFHFLLGYDHQPQIKDRLEELVYGTKIFRKDFYLKCTLKPEQGSMRLNVECRFEVVNPTNETHKYLHAVQCERVEKPTAGLMTLVSEQQTYGFVPSLTYKADDPLVLEAKGEEIDISPAAKGTTYKFGSKFSMLYPEEFFYAVHVGVPTIGMTIEVEPPEGFQVTASPTRTCAKNIWTYDKLFMPGEHVDIRWERSNPVRNSN